MKTAFTLLAGICLSFNVYSQNWSLTGNSGTTPPTTFLGTTDPNRLVFKTNSTERMTFHPMATWASAPLRRLCPCTL